MFIKITKFIAILAAALALTACGGGVQEGAPQGLALSGAAPVQMAAGAPAAAAAAPAAAADRQAVNSSDPAVRTLLWEQSISLEMNRQHEEQLERARIAAAQPEVI